MNNLPDINQTWFQCISCGHKVSLLENKTFKCTTCSDLQRVEHDFNHGWNKSYKNTTSSLTPMGMSGVWKYSGLNGIIMPRFPQEYMISLGEGNEPILEIGSRLRKWLGQDVDLRIMLQGMNPTGSFKDRGMPVAISVASALGIKAVVCSSTGDTSAAAAAYAARAGIQCYVLIPEDREDTSVVQWHQPDAYGAQTIVIPGRFDDGMRVVQEFADNGLVYLVNSRNSLRIEGHMSATIQIAENFGWNMPDIIAVPVGNGSDSTSVGQGIRRLLDLKAIEKGSKILGVQVASAAPLYYSMKKASTENGDVTESSWNSCFEVHSPGRTVATAMNIGNPVSRKKVVHEIIRSNGGMEIADENELLTAMDLCNKDGIPICQHTAVVLVGIKKSLQSGLISKDDSIVCISTATHMKFPEILPRHRKMDMVIANDCRTDTIAKIMNL